MLARGPATARIAVTSLSNTSLKDSAPPHPGTILLVEDEAAVLLVTRRMLTGAGYAVLTATDAGVARAVFAEHAHSIDLLITDIIMPGESGVALATALRTAEPALEVLFISGYTNSELPDAERTAADDELMQKPFTVPELLTSVAHRLARRRPRLPTDARTQSRPPATP